MKGRIKFTVMNNSELLLLVRDHFIHSGYVLVQDQLDADFVLLDTTVSNCVRTIRPALCLSTGSVYSDRDKFLKQTKKVPMSEDHGCVILSVLEPAMYKVLHALHSEWVTTYHSKTIIARVFNVYGPDISQGVVPTFIKHAKEGRPLPVHGSGYQTRTFLHQEDFLSCIEVLARKLVGGTTGIYNVGHTSEITINNLAETIWQLTQPQSIGTVTQHVQPPEYHAQWKLPDVTRVKALANWSPMISVRRGLWRMINE